MKRILLLIALVLSASIFTAFAAVEPFNGKSPAEYANDPKSDLSGAPRNFVTAVAQEDAIHELQAMAPKYLSINGLHTNHNRYDKAKRTYYGVLYLWGIISNDGIYHS